MTETVNYKCKCILKRKEINLLKKYSLYSFFCSKIELNIKITVIIIIVIVMKEHLKIKYGN